MMTLPYEIVRLANAARHAIELWSREQEYQWDQSPSRKSWEKYKNEPDPPSEEKEED